MKNLEKHSKNIMKKTVMRLYHDTEYSVIENNVAFNKEACTNVIYTRLTVRYPFMKCNLTYDYITEMTDVFSQYLNDKLTVNQYHASMKKLLDMLAYRFRHANELYLD